MTEELQITARTRVGAMLEAYPQLESILVGYAPAFAKLRNPVLRRTVAKVATLAQAARVAGVDVGDLVLALRREVGQTSATNDQLEPAAHACAAAAHAPRAAGEHEPPPEWVSAGRVCDEIHADALLEAGETPLGPIMRRARTLQAGELVRVTSSFAPAPLIDTLRDKGYRVHAHATGSGGYETLIGSPS